MLVDNQCFDYMRDFPEEKLMQPSKDCLQKEFDFLKKILINETFDVIIFVLEDIFMACCKKTASAETREKAVEKTPAQKAVDTRRKNIIAEQKEMLDKSTSSAAHKQWITKKNNEISAKDEKIAKLTSEKKDLKAELKKLQVENKALAKEVARLEKKLAAKPAVKTESKAPAKTNTKTAPAKASKTAKAAKK